MNEEILQLEKTVDSLEQWKRLREEERLQFPIDEESRKTLKTYKTVNTSGLIECRNKITDVYLGNTLSELLDFGIEVTINGKKRVIFVNYRRKRITVNATSNVITSADGNHNLRNGDMVIFTSTNTLPAPLDSFTSYYVINSNGAEFKVSLTAGGSEVNITDVGAGTHYYS